MASAAITHSTHSASAAPLASSPGSNGSNRSESSGSSSASQSPQSSFIFQRDDDFQSPVLSTQFPGEFDPRNFALTGNAKLFTPRSKADRVELSSVLGSIVKIFTVSTPANWVLPWQTKQQYEKSGSGFILEGRKIITNAHCVADQSYVTVRKHGDPTKYLARVVAVGHECDLAVLTTLDDKFWEGTEALQLGEIPELQDPVAVVGYPLGGDNLSVSVGVVSRVEPQQYAHGATCLLAIQIDAAINPGNSGGPAMMDNKVVGVAFQGLKGAENIGFIIPTIVVQHFLQDIERSNGRFTGFPVLGVHFQPLENPQLRSYVGLKENETGVLLTKFRPLSDAAEKFEIHDVLLSVDGEPVGNDGSVMFRGRERISFEYILWQKFAHDKVPVTVLRDGKQMDLVVEVDVPQPAVPVQQYDKMPRYIIYSGLVFVPLSQPYLREYGDDWYNKCPRVLCDKAFNWEPSQSDEEIVILSQVLQDSSNRGFEPLCNLQVIECNNVKVKNLNHLIELLDQNQSQYQKIVMQDNRLVILEREVSQSCHTSILQRHRISWDRNQ